MEENMLFGLCSGKGRKSVSDEHSSIASAARQQTSPIGSPNGSPRAAAVIAAKGVNPSEASQVADEKILNGLLPGVILNRCETIIEQSNNKAYSSLRYQLVRDDVELFKSKLCTDEGKKEMILLKFSDAGDLEAVVFHTDLLAYMHNQRNEIEYCSRHVKGFDGDLYSVTSKPAFLEFNSKEYNKFVKKISEQL